ncbi:MAG: 2-octaprenyl-6-methoxyphenyl hydroxylase [Pseudomonadota bacterium]
MSVHETLAYDVVIVGGGAVGSVLALALAPLRLRVALVEATAPSNDALAPGDASQARCTALSMGSQRMLETLGVWPHLQSAATPIRHIHVSDRGQFGSTRLDAQHEGVTAFGQVVENVDLQHRLWARLSSLGRRVEVPGAPAPGELHLWAPAHVTDTHAGLEAATVTLARAAQRAPIQLRAQLLVAADGARSSIRRLLSVGADQQSYRQQAIIANITPQRPHGHVAYERFIGSGPLALLPLSGGRCNLVWTVWRDDAEALLALAEAEFLEALQDAFGFRLGRFLQASPRAAFPLWLSRARDDLLPPRVALVGNAATGVHPVAGQGLNLGLRDAAGLAESIADALAAGTADVGAGVLLSAFLRWRKEDRGRVSAFTDALVRVFTQPAAPIGMARGLGLLALDLMPGAKSAFARGAMGMGGRAPRLSRGLPLASPRRTAARSTP